jgi:hypothetical protein
MLYGIGVTDSAVIYFEEDHELVGTEALFGREYVLEVQERREVPVVPGGIVDTTWIRYRQDRAGLYEADISINEPPAVPGGRIEHTNSEGTGRRWNALWARLSNEAGAKYDVAFDRAWAKMARKLAVIYNLAEGSAARPHVEVGRPGGVLPDEITRLVYPLRPGQEWTVRESPFFSSKVDGRDILDLPPGRISCSRIRMTIQGLDPEDVVLFWYGRDGFLGQLVHVQTEVVDINGQEIGVLSFKESVLLESIDLVRPGRF